MNYSDKYSGHGSSDYGTYKYSEHERFGNRDDDPIAQLRENYWTAKQVLRARVFGKKEDEHLVASDSELDAKLAVFYSIKDTCEAMLRCIEHYQDFICELSQDENELGRFLKRSGKADKTQAGKMMASVGRAETFTAQQRLSLRVPLVRLYAELEVFTERAVVDCEETVRACERARHEYRGSLLWMKKVSKELDPDMYRQMEKYRQVQACVRRNKAKFDKRKLDVLQKVDLLSASRCNLFSNLLTNYQNCLVKFWDVTSSAHNTISETFKGYQHYEFTILKDFNEPSRRLAAITAGQKKEENKSEEDAKAEEEPSLVDLSTSASVDVQSPPPPQSESAANLQALLFNDSPERKRNENLIDDLIEATPMPAKKHHGGQEDQLSQLFAARANVKEQTASDGGARGQHTTQSLIDAFLTDASHVTDHNSFSYQWQHTFDVRRTAAPSGTDKVSDSPEHKASSSNVLPSQLLDFGNIQETSSSSKNEPSDAKLTAWYNLFADVDPLKQQMDESGAA